MFAILFIYHQGKCPFIVRALIEQVPPNTQTQEPGGVYLFNFRSSLGGTEPRVFGFRVSTLEIGPWGLVIGFWIGFDFVFRICQMDFGAIPNQFSAYAVDFGLAF